MRSRFKEIVLSFVKLNKNMILIIRSDTLRKCDLPDRTLDDVFRRMLTVTGQKLCNSRFDDFSKTK